MSSTISCKKKLFTRMLAPNSSPSLSALSKLESVFFSLASSSAAGRKRQLRRWDARSKQLSSHAPSTLLRSKNSGVIQSTMRS